MTATVLLVAAPAPSFFAAPLAAEARRAGKTARALGLPIPPSLMLRADQVIQ